MLTFIIVLTALAGLAYYINSKPDDFRVSRSTVIAAPAATVFPHVNDLHNWNAWSPWAKLDPACVTTFEGAPAGTGAIMRWSGNNKVGQGSMTITQSRPNELVGFKLEFLKPFKATNSAEFAFAPQGNQTAVTWSMTGKSNFMSKAMSLFMNCEKMVGGQFDKGLADLKRIAESQAS